MHPLISTHTRWRILYGIPIALFLFLAVLPVRAYRHQPLFYFSGLDITELNLREHKVYLDRLDKRMTALGDKATRDLLAYANELSVADAERATDATLSSSKWSLILVVLILYAILVGLMFGWYELDRLFFRKNRDPLKIRNIIEGPPK